MKIIDHFLNYIIHYEYPDEFRLTGYWFGIKNIHLLAAIQYRHVQYSLLIYQKDHVIVSTIFPDQNPQHCHSDEASYNSFKESLIWVQTMHQYHTKNASE